MPGLKYVEAQALLGQTQYTAGNDASSIEQQSTFKTIHLAYQYGVLHNHGPHYIPH